MKTCGDCVFGQPAKAEDGTINFTIRTCYGFPPTPLLAPGPGGRPVPVGIRPTVGAQDPACSLFKQKISLDTSS